MPCQCESSSSNNLLLIGVIVISILLTVFKDLWYEFEAWFNERICAEVKHAIRDLHKDGDLTIREIKDDTESEIESLIESPIQSEIIVEKSEI